jgi:transketolase
MMSVAAGLAMSGLRPVVYTITPFTTTRCLEQIKIDVCYHNAPVVIVGVGAGLSYASLGGTHQSLEDISFLRVLPGMSVVCPGDALEVRAALAASLRQPGPVYIRLGKKGEPVVHQAPPDFQLGKALVVRPGSDVCILSTGNLLPVAVEAADRLASSNISAEVVSYHTVKPLDEEFLARAFHQFALVTTLEEHSLLGGLGSAVAEWVVDHGPVTGRLLRLGTPDVFLHEAGEQEHVREVFGLTPEAVSARIQQLYSTAPQRIN